MTQYNYNRLRKKEEIWGATTNPRRMFQCKFVFESKQFST